mmetsp:Transcript_67425/g.161743  ORF Transcript_67425/g.161743 Transcript_67425/m.161743 type:complete len:336 (+) Transcript_67425:68-1075(+)
MAVSPAIISSGRTQAPARPYIGTLRVRIKSAQLHGLQQDIFVWQKKGHWQGCKAAQCNSYVMVQCPSWPSSAPEVQATSVVPATEEPEWDEVKTFAVQWSDGSPPPLRIDIRHRTERGDFDLSTTALDFPAPDERRWVNLSAPLWSHTCAHCSARMEWPASLMVGKTSLRCLCGADAGAGSLSLSLRWTHVLDEDDDSEDIEAGDAIPNCLAPQKTGECASHISLGGRDPVLIDEVKLEIVQRFGSVTALWLAEIRSSAGCSNKGLNRVAFEHAVRQVAPFMPQGQLDLLWQAARHRGDEVVYFKQFKGLFGQPPPLGFDPASVKPIERRRAWKP